MGLTTWKNAPKGKILKSDVNIAKNYLTSKEIVELNRIVSMYLEKSWPKSNMTNTGYHKTGTTCPISTNR